ncbi:hypothetical protein BLNAU_22090 [Blattamonas nauphoetae]|uniref:Ubiquitin-like domain-containing protein n=1 Tax=Blattamonas nauphoetae TaxID=2049346 RepID=A0ABQ9WTZ4_9EUKA|nr:hypothetical protein BLNAU_22090 [Blattamonas nauphoetae]
MSEATIKIKSVRGDGTTVTITDGMTILQVKEKISEQLSIPVTEQKLIFNGRIAKMNKRCKNSPETSNHNNKRYTNRLPNTTNFNTSAVWRTTTIARIRQQPSPGFEGAWVECKIQSINATSYFGRFDMGNSVSQDLKQLLPNLVNRTKEPEVLEGWGKGEPGMGKWRASQLRLGKGGRPGMGWGMPDMQTMMQMMQNPFVQQQLQQFMQDPQAMQQVMNSRSVQQSGKQNQCLKLNAEVQQNHDCLPKC